MKCTHYMNEQYMKGVLKNSKKYFFGVHSHVGFIFQCRGERQYPSSVDETVSTVQQRPKKVIFRSQRTEMKDKMDYRFSCDDGVSKGHAL